MSTGCKMNLLNIFAPNLKIIIAKKKKKMKDSRSPLGVTEGLLLLLLYCLCVCML